MVVIYIPFVLARYDTILHRCPAAMPHVVSRLSLLLCHASLYLCLCSHGFMLLASFLQVYVSSVTVEMNHVHKKMIMPTCANTRGHPTRPVICNGMIIIIDHFITMTPLRSIPPQHRTLAGPIRPHAHNIASPFLRRPRTAPGICRRRYCTTQMQVLCKRVRTTINPAKACAAKQSHGLFPGLLHPLLLTVLRQHKRPPSELHTDRHLTFHPVAPRPFLQSVWSVPEVT